MIITEEILRIIRDRVVQVCIAKYDVEPSRIMIGEDYGIECEHEYPVWGGGTDIDTYHLDVNDLSADLDVLIKERKEKQEQERIKEEARRIEEKRLQEERAKERRRVEYLKLKEEFES